MIVKPFKAIRPDVKFANILNVPPYDVVDTNDVKRFIKNNNYSFFHITRAEADLEGVDEHSDAVYLKAKENLDRFLKDKVLFQDEKPMYYLLSQTWQGRTQTGLYAAVSCQEYIDNKIKKHELTRKDKEEDRTKHIWTTGVGTGPIFLAFEKTPDYDKLVTPIKEKSPAYHFTDENQVENKLWPIEDDKTVKTLEDYFKTVPALYIADGHHRAASAVNVYKKMVDQGKKAHIDDGYQYFMAVIFPSSDLKILAYNRVVSGLNGLSEKELLDKIGEKFDVKKADSPEALKKGEIKMLLGKETYLLTPKNGSYDKNNPLDSLDVSILQKNILAPLLGIEDPRTSKDIKFVGGIKGTGELQRLVQSGDAKAAFSLYPVSMEELMAIVNRDDIMPPKSTWFEPKLRDGLVSYRLMV